MKRIKYFLIMIIVISFMFGCVADGKITARDILKDDEDADILKYNGLIYSNFTNVEWFEDQKGSYEKNIYVGEIEKQTTNRLFFPNLAATQLPVGTELYAISEGNLSTLIVEVDNVLLYYRLLLEG